MKKTFPRLSLLSPLFIASFILLSSASGSAQDFQNSTTAPLSAGKLLGQTLSLSSDFALFNTAISVGQAGQAVGTGEGTLTATAKTKIYQEPGTYVSAITGALWGAGLSGLSMWVFKPRFSDATGNILVLGGATAGFIAGGAFAHTYEVSWGRALAINGMGFAGLILGVTIGDSLFEGDKESHPDVPNLKEVSASAIVGSVVGIASGILITRNWNQAFSARNHEPSASLFFVPTDGGAIAGLGGSF